MIPKNIYQIYLYEKDIPIQIKDNIDRIKKQNPNYKYRLFTEKDIDIFIKNNYSKDIYDTYNTINWNVVKADLFRYLLIYKIGGIYLDIKSCFKKPLDDIIKIDNNYILSYWKKPCNVKLLGHSKGEFVNFFIISKPNHPFLKKVIDNVIKNIKNYNGEIGKKIVLKLSGPIVYTKTILPLLDKYPNNIYDNFIDLGIQYVKIKNYKELFTTHYTKLTTPIII